MTNDGAQPAQHSCAVMHATPRGRRLLTLLLILAAGVLALFLRFGLPYFTAMLNTATPPAANAILLIKCCFAGLAVLGVASAAGLIIHARSILRSRQCPPPGAWVWRDTRIVRGTQAARRAWLYIVVAIVCCLACIGLAIYIALMLDRLAPHYRLPPGVTIIQQKSFTTR